MESKEVLKPTAARLIIVRECAEGPKKFGQLRTAFFGEERAKANKATTSFYNKLTQGLKEGLVVKTSTGVYELGDEGKKLLAFAKKEGIDLAKVKSEAEMRHIREIALKA